MRRRRNRQELGNALNDRKDNQLNERHGSIVIPSIAAKGRQGRCDHKVENAYLFVGDNRYVRCRPRRFLRSTPASPRTPFQSLHGQTVLTHDEPRRPPSPSVNCCGSFSVAHMNNHRLACLPAVPPHPRRKSSAPMEGKSQSRRTTAAISLFSEQYFHTHRRARRLEPGPRPGRDP